MNISMSVFVHKVFQFFRCFLLLEKFRIFYVWKINVCLKSLLPFRVYTKNMVCYTERQPYPVLNKQKKTHSFYVSLSNQKNKNCVSPSNNHRIEITNIKSYYIFSKLMGWPLPPHTTCSQKCKFPFFPFSFEGFYHVIRACCEQERSVVVTMRWKMMAAGKNKNIHLPLAMIESP